MLARLCATFAAAMGAALLPAAAFAQTPVHWKLSADAAHPLKPGAHFTAVAAASIDPGWHVYSLTQPPGGPRALVITIKKSPAFTPAGPITSQPPTKAFDPNFNMETEFHENGIDVSLPLVVAKGAPGGKPVLVVDVEYQVCNDRLCLPPAEETLRLPIAVDGIITNTATKTAPTAPEAPAAPAAPAAPEAPGTSRTSRTSRTSSTSPNHPIPDLAATKASSFPAFIGLAATMGFLSLLTPCVFPMVPITVSYFTNRGSTSRRDAALQALVYGAGIVLTFTGAGLALALLFGASGLNQFAANPWINLGIAALFVGFALSLFGRVTVALPASVVTKAVGAERGRGRFAGTLLMGFAFTLTSFTCTAPFLGSLLVVAAQGEWKWPAAGMLVFASVFALPFVILALVPQRLSSLPRAGAWLQSVKSAMGLLEIAAAMKFLSNVDLVWGWGIFTRSVVLVVWTGVAVVLMWQLLRGRTPARLVLAAASLALAVWLANGVRGARLGELEAFLPPASARVLAAGQEPDWIVNDYAGALATARAEHRPLLIDFTGYTCTNCRWMEANMFPRPEVAVELSRYVRVRLYTDGQGDLYRGFQNMQRDTYGTVALPYYAAVSPEGEPRVGFGGLTRNPDEFIAFLRTGLE